jgi:hypothetical protein
MVDSSGVETAPGPRQFTPLTRPAPWDIGGSHPTPTRPAPRGHPRQAGSVRGVDLGAELLEVRDPFGVCVVLVDRLVV